MAPALSLGAAEGMGRGDLELLALICEARCHHRGAFYFADTLKTRSSFRMIEDPFNIEWLGEGRLAMAWPEPSHTPLMEHAELFGAGIAGCFMKAGVYRTSFL